MPASGITLPRIRIVIDNKTETLVDLTSGITSYQVSNSLTSGNTYEVFIQIVATEQGYGNRFGSAGVSPTNVVRITGFNIASGSLVAMTSLPNGNGIIYGDPLVEGVQTNNSISYPSDRSRSFAQYVGIGLGCEYGTVGFGGQGWNQAGNGSVPIFPSTWNYHSTGRPRSFTTVPTWAIVMHGTNGSVVSATVQSWITSFRAAVGSSTWIFVVVPPGCFGKTELTSAVNNYSTANPSDTKVKLIDVSDIIPTQGMDAFYAGTYATTDGIHMRDWMHGYFGSVVARKMTEQIGGLSGGGGGSGTYPSVGTVLSGTSYGPNGSDYTGNLTLPTTTNVLLGVQYGAAGTQYTGNITLPTVSQVEQGVTYGSNGTQYTGTLVSLTDQWDSIIEGSVTARQMMMLMGSVLLGKSSGMNSNNPTFRNILDNKDRVVATTDSNGNRTSVITDVT